MDFATADRAAVRWPGAFAVFALAVFVAGAAHAQGDFHAIVGPKGNVVLCLSKGDILHADTCAGTGRLRIVQPLRPGRLVWRSAAGSVTLENEAPQNPDCALSRAKWDTKAERPADSGKRIGAIDPVAVLLQMSKSDYVRHLQEGDVTAFTIDLDGDGNDEIVFVASSLQRAVEASAKAGSQPQDYVVVGGILRKDLPYALPFHFEQGKYPANDVFPSRVTIDGVVPMAPGEIGLVVRIGSHVSDTGKLVRFRRHDLQQIDFITKTCD